MRDDLSVSGATIESVTSGHKWPTCLLLKADGQLHSFGQVALDAYHALSASDSRQWLLFERFKMPLYIHDRIGKLTRHTCVQAANGQQAPILHVISLALKYLARRVLQHVRQVCGQQLPTDAIRWVLTVPAVWTSSAKQLMRQAAYDAGLASRVNPEQLLIALEAEAASIFCRSLPLAQQLDCPSQVKIESLLPGMCVWSTCKYLYRLFHLD